MKLCFFVLAALIIVPLPTVIILFFLQEHSEILKFAISSITASLTLLLGWIFTTNQNIENFFRSETIKHKEKLISLIEKFFDDFVEKLESRTFTEQDRVIFVNDKVSDLEFKHSIQQKIYGKKAVVFLSDESFAKLRMVWQMNGDDFKKHKRHLQDLKDDILQEIENNYIQWLK